MKKFFEEYGKVAIAAIVIILLLVMIKPIGAAIQNGIENIPLPGLTGVSSSNTSLVEKGDIITIDSKQYRVLESNGNQAKLLAMYNACENCYEVEPDPMSMSQESHYYSEVPFDNTGITTYINEHEVQKYEGSYVDNYLENDFYQSLSFKNAIVKKTITQSVYTYVFDGSAYDASYSASWAPDPNFPVTPNYIKKTGEIPVGERHVYLLDVKDIIDYLGSDLAPTKLNMMFWNVEDLEPAGEFDYIYLHLRSSTEDSSACVWYFGCTFDNIEQGAYYDYRKVYPAFVVDLSKVEWSKVQ